MHSAKVVEFVGSPNSALVVAAPRRHFHTRRSLASCSTSRITSVAPPATAGDRQSSAGTSSSSQSPSPSQVSVVQGSSSPSHGLPAGSNRQVASQPPPPALLPSSQPPPPSSTPLPQRPQPATQAS